MNQKEDKGISAIWTGLHVIVRGSCSGSGAFFHVSVFVVSLQHTGPATAATVIVQVYHDKLVPLHFRGLRVIVARAMNFMTDTCGEFVKRKEIMRRTRDRVADCNSDERSIARHVKMYFSRRVMDNKNKGNDNSIILNTVELHLSESVSKQFV